MSAQVRPRSASKQFAAAEAEVKQLKDSLSKAEGELDDAKAQVVSAEATHELNGYDDASYELVRTADEKRLRTQIRVDRTRKSLREAEARLHEAKQEVLGEELDRLAPQVTESALLEQLRPLLIEHASYEQGIRRVVEKASAIYASHKARYEQVVEYEKQLHRKVLKETGEAQSLSLWFLATRLLGEIHIRLGITRPDSNAWDGVGFRSEHRLLCPTTAEAARRFLAGDPVSPAAEALIKELADMLTKREEEPLAAE
jgi:hypothetical protein